jgi:ABC-2 type transport system permease protein
VSTAAGEARGSAGYYHLARAVLYREYLLFVRYPADALGGVVISLLFFGLIFYGGTLLAGQEFADNLAGIVVGYFLWSMSIVAYQGSSNDIASEAQWGTLERHYMTPFGFGPVMFAKGAAKVVRSFVIASVTLAVMIAVTGTVLTIDVFTIVPVAALSLLSVLGVGFAAGGVTVLYKRIGNWTGLLQFGFIGLISAPAFGLGWARLLPLTQGSSLLQRAMQDGVRLWEFPLVDLAVLSFTALLYPLLGYVVFYVAHRRARKLGVLGDY